MFTIEANVVCKTRSPCYARKMLSGMSFITLFTHWASVCRREPAILSGDADIEVPHISSSGRADLMSAADCASLTAMLAGHNNLASRRVACRDTTAESGAKHGSKTLAADKPRAARRLPMLHEILLRRIRAHQWH